ncbi:hypothetical protein [Viridibacillus arvi]|uniref:hypothetical protein n=1 Tax=Viridibacillus arvi TaxID=263475 RepID=UPI003D0385AB
MLYKKTSSKVYRVMPIGVEQSDGEYKEYLCLANERGRVYSKEEMMELFETLKEFYERMGPGDSNELLEDYNKRVKLDEYVHALGSYGGITMNLNEDDKYQVPPAIYKFKKFNPDKRNWSCKCNWCGEKVSSKIDEGYYKIHYVHFNINSETACSEDCAKLIWKEGIKNWVQENGYQKYFE